MAKKVTKKKASKKVAKKTAKKKVSKTPTKTTAKRKARPADNKTKANFGSVSAFLTSIADDERRKDCKAVAKLMKDITKATPKMWGASIVGFGSQHLIYDSGRELDWFLVGFSPRKRDLTLYIMGGLEGHGELLEKLGKHKTGKACLYVKRLADVDLAVLEKLIKQSVKRSLTDKRAC